MRTIVSSAFLLSLCVEGQNSAFLEGTAVDAATKAPLTGARVRVTSFPAQTQTYSRVDREGRFSIPVSALSVYQLDVENPGYARYHIGINFNPKARAVPDTVRTVDENGATHVNVTAALSQYGVIAGRVTDPYGLPMRQCTIELLRKRKLPAPVGPTPQNPDYEQVNFAQQPEDCADFRVQTEPGTYWIVVRKSGGIGDWPSTFRATYFPSALSIEGGTPVTVAAGKTVRADMQIVERAGVRVSGKIQLPGAAAGPFLYTAISLVPADNPLINSTGPFTSGNERFEFADVLPGKYKLNAVTRDAASDRTGMNQTIIAALKRDVVIGDRDQDALDLTMEPLAEMAGEVTFAEGCTAAPVEIKTSIYSPTGRGDVEATSDGDGKFILKRLIPGKVTLLVRSTNPAHRLASIHLGEREVSRGFEVPDSSGEPIRLSMTCGRKP